MSLDMDIFLRHPWVILSILMTAEIFDIHFLSEMGSRHWVRMVYTPKKIFRPSEMGQWGLSWPQFLANLASKPLKLKVKSKVKISLAAEKSAAQVLTCKAHNFFLEPLGGSFFSYKPPPLNIFQLSYGAFKSSERALEHTLIQKMKIFRSRPLFKMTKISSN